MGWFTPAREDLTRCYNGGQQHCFQARYTETERRSSMKLESVTGFDVRAFMTLNVYMHDICVWCGKVVSPTRPPEKEKSG